MYLSKKHKAIFIHIPKTAGKSITSVLRKNNFKIIQLQCAPDKSNDDKTGAYKLGTVQRALRKTSYETMKNNYKFAFVRNPYDRAVSNYYFLGYRGKMSFNTFLKTELKKVRDVWHHTLTQSQHIHDKDGNLMVDFIGKFENLQEDFDKICDKIGLARVQLPHNNASGKKGRENCLTEENKQIIYDLYKIDFDNFGYSK